MSANIQETLEQDKKTKEESLGLSTIATTSNESVSSLVSSSASSLQASTQPVIESNSGLEVSSQEMSAAIAGKKATSPALTEQDFKASSEAWKLRLTAAKETAQRLSAERVAGPTPTATVRSAMPLLPNPQPVLFQFREEQKKISDEKNKAFEERMKALDAQLASQRQSSQAQIDQIRASFSQPQRATTLPSGAIYNHSQASGNATLPPRR